MEHASRGRRCGNEGVEARLRGRFRIFSARHRSRIEAAPRGKFRNDGGLGVVAVCSEGCCGGMCWPVDRPATHAAAGAAARGVRGGLGDYFAVGLGAVAGAWVDHRSGQTRMPPQERRHEEVFGLGDSFTPAGAAAREVRGMGGLFHMLGSGGTRELGFCGCTRGLRFLVFTRADGA